VIFVENFEEGSLDAVWKRWDSFYPDPNGTPFEGFRWRSTKCETKPKFKARMTQMLLWHQ
jgi:hypothetical protein